MVNSKIIGCGHYLPQKILKNDDFKEFIDTSDEWIFTRTGIKQRHIASEKQYTSDLAIQAAKIAIQNANIDKNEIDCIIIISIQCFIIFVNKNILWVFHKINTKFFTYFHYEFILKCIINIGEKYNCYRISLFCKEHLKNFYSRQGFNKTSINMKKYL